MIMTYPELLEALQDEQKQYLQPYTKTVIFCDGSTFYKMDRAEGDEIIPTDLDTFNWLMSLSNPDTFTPAEKSIIATVSITQISAIKR